MRHISAYTEHIKRPILPLRFLAYKILRSACLIGYEDRGGVKLRMAKSKKNKIKAKLNLTVRDEQRNKLEQMASLENRSVSNLIEVMADERWERLVEQQASLTLKPSRGRRTLDSTRTIQQTARNCAGQFSILSRGVKWQIKQGRVEILSFSFSQTPCSAIHIAIARAIRLRLCS